MATWSRTGSEAFGKTSATCPTPAKSPRSRRTTSSTSVIGRCGHEGEVSPRAEWDGQTRYMGLGWLNRMTHPGGNDGKTTGREPLVPGNRDPLVRDCGAARVRAANRLGLVRVRR